VTAERPEISPPHFSDFIFMTASAVVRLHRWNEGLSAAHF
jgi:hypothetical protein